MKIVAPATSFGFLVALWGAPFVAHGGTASKAGHYAASSLADGTIEITVTGKVTLPSGQQVAVIDLPSTFKVAAEQECPDGYDVTAPPASTLGASPNGRGLVARLKGAIRCKRSAP
jgi:hypothetical protein